MVEDGFPYIVLEWMPGGTVIDYLKVNRRRNILQLVSLTQPIEYTIPF